MPTNYPLWEAPEDIPLEERRDFAVCRLLTEKARAAAADARATAARRRGIVVAAGRRGVVDSAASGWRTAATARTVADDHD